MKFINMMGNFVFEKHDWAIWTVYLTTSCPLIFEVVLCCPLVERK